MVINTLSLPLIIAQERHGLFITNNRLSILVFLVMLCFDGKKDWITLEILTPWWWKRIHISRIEGILLKSWCKTTQFVALHNIIVLWNEWIGWLWRKFNVEWQIYLNHFAKKLSTLQFTWSIDHCQFLWILKYLKEFG